MTKQEQIEEIARILKDHCVFHPERICDECIHKDRRMGDFMVCEEYLKAEELYNSGYGNTKQAVREFAEALKEYANNCQHGIGVNDIDEILKRRADD